MSIRLSEKYGVNPSLGVCFWCGQDDGTVLLMGRMDRGGLHDIEAPRHACVTYEPCAKCQSGMDLGITIIEASEEPTYKGQPAMQRGVYPTGTYCVLTEDAIKRLIITPEFLEQVLAKRVAFMDSHTYHTLFDEVISRKKEASNE